MSTAQQLPLPFEEPTGTPPEEQRARVRGLTRELMQRVRNQWPSVHFPDPRVEFRLRGRSAGEACPRTNFTNYNSELLERHGDEFIDEIVPHEVAHLVAARLHPGRIRPHGREWRAVMGFFGVVPRVSHRFEAMPVPEAGQFAYRCECESTHWLTRRAHRRVQRRTWDYFCRSCGSRLVRKSA